MREVALVAFEKMIDLDAEISTKKAIVALVFEIGGGGIYIAMILMNQDIMVLFQIVVLMFKICCLGTVIFPLVSLLVEVVIEEQHSWIFYYKF